MSTVLEELPQALGQSHDHQDSDRDCPANEQHHKEDEAPADEGGEQECGQRHVGDVPDHSHAWVRVQPNRLVVFFGASVSAETLASAGSGVGSSLGVGSTGAVVARIGIT